MSHVYVKEDQEDGSYQCKDCPTTISVKYKTKMKPIAEISKESELLK